MVHGRRPNRAAAAAAEAMWSASQLLSLPDGRNLAITECGTPGGRPVIYLHGTPGSRLNRYPFDEELARLQVRLITYDRPGYGASTRCPGRDVAAAAHDVRMVADHLGLAAVPVFGHSGGGPHAIACAALLGGRVTKAAAVAALAPFDAADSGWFEGLPETTVTEFQTARQGREQLEAYLAPAVGQIAEKPAAFGELLDQDLPDADRDFLAHPAVRAVMGSAVRLAVEQGSGGWVDDDIAHLTDWGFSPASVRTPLALWHGALDTLVPPGHLQRLAARIPQAQVSLEPGHGHSSIQLEHPGIIRWLLDEG